MRQRADCRAGRSTCPSRRRAASPRSPVPASGQSRAAGADLSPVPRRPVARCPVLAKADEQQDRWPSVPAVPFASRAARSPGVSATTAPATSATSDPTRPAVAPRRVTNRPGPCRAASERFSTLSRSLRRTRDGSAGRDGKSDCESERTVLPSTSTLEEARAAATPRPMLCEALGQPGAGADSKCVGGCGRFLGGSLVCRGVCGGIVAAAGVSLWFGRNQS